MRSQSFPLAGQRAFLEIFGPLLAHNITVYHPRTGRYGLLKGLPATYEGQGEPLADVEFYADAEAQAEGCGDITEPVAKILPVLYSFEDLMLPIEVEPGRYGIAAVVMLKKLGYAVTELRLFGAGQPADSPTHLIEAYDANGNIQTVLYPDWGLGIGDLPLPWAQVCWEHHFAVGLRPEQYHRKQVTKPFEYLTLGEPLPLVTPCPSKRSDCPSGCPACPTEKEVARA